MPKLASPMPTSACRRYSSPKVCTIAVESVSIDQRSAPGKDQRLSRKVIAEPSGQRSREHIRDEKSESQAADALIVHLESALHQRLHACQHIAVGVVQQV